MSLHNPTNDTSDDAQAIATLSDGLGAYLRARQRGDKNPHLRSYATAYKQWHTFMGVATREAAWTATLAERDAKMVARDAVRAEFRANEKHRVADRWQIYKNTHRDAFLERRRATDKKRRAKRLVASRLRTAANPKKAQAVSKKARDAKPGYHARKSRERRDALPDTCVIEMAMGRKSIVERASIPPLLLEVFRLHIQIKRELKRKKP